MTNFSCGSSTGCARIPFGRGPGYNLRHGGADPLGIQIPNNRRPRGKQKRGVVDVRPRLADDVEELGHKTEAVDGGVKK